MGDDLDRIIEVVQQVVERARLGDDHGVDARLVQELTKQQARGARANDGDLSAHDPLPFGRKMPQDREMPNGRYVKKLVFSGHG